jgi:HEAT repeat protein
VAADALGEIGSDAAIEELVKALNDEDSYVR